MRPAPGLRDQQPLLAEPPQRLAHRPLASTEALRQRKLDEALARTDAPLGDVVAQGQIDVLVQAAYPRFRLDYSGGHGAAPMA